MEGEYETLLDEYDRLASSATAISFHSSGIKTNSRRVFVASQLFTGICGRLISLFRLLPHSRLHGTSLVSWDTSSIASIARSVVEACHVYYYLAIDNVEAVEIEARFDLVELHYLTDYCAILTGFGENEDGYAKSQSG